jgi:hypothetical protein
VSDRPEHAKNLTGISIEELSLGEFVYQTTAQSKYLLQFEKGSKIGGNVESR